MYCDPISGIKELELVSFLFLCFTNRDDKFYFVGTLIIKLAESKHSSVLKNLLFQVTFFRFTTVSLK